MLDHKYYKPCLMLTLRWYLSSKLSNPTKTRLQTRAFVKNQQNYLIKRPEKLHWPQLLDDTYAHLFMRKFR